MKKVLSFIILMACAVTGAWAGSDVVITTTNDSKNVSDWTFEGGQNNLSWGFPNSITIQNGRVFQEGLDGIKQYTGSPSNGPCPFDLSGATLDSNVNSFVDDYSKILLPNNVDVSTITFGTTNLQYALSKGDNINIFVNSGQDALIGDLGTVDVTKQYYLYGTGAMTLKQKLVARDVPETNINMPGFVATAIAAWSGDDVVITTNSADDLNGITGSTTAIKNGSQTNIWEKSFNSGKKLIVNGELSQAGLTKIESCLTTNSDGKHILDISNSLLSGSITSLPQLSWNPGGYILSYFTSALLPAGTPISFTVPDGYDFVYSPATETSDSYLYIGKAYSSLNEALSAIGMTTESITATNKLDLKGSEAQALYDQLINAGVSADNILYTSLGEFADADGCYFTIDETKEVFTVHTPVAGHFKAIFDRKINYAQAYDGYTFKFDSESHLNEDDLLTLAVGDQYNYSKGKHYYVDLFDVEATSLLCHYQTGYITNVINTIRENNVGKDANGNTQGFLGLILPKDHTFYGTGTTLIQGKNKGDANSANDVPTCKDFIVYYKTRDNEDPDFDNHLTVAHIYDIVSNSSLQTYQDKFDKMYALLSAHQEVIDNTDIYQISTNWQLLYNEQSSANYEKIDISVLGDDVAFVETYNNEMVRVSTAANMISHPLQGGDFATSAEATGMKNTPTEKLTIVGPMSADDFTAIGNFATGKGPRVLDLRGVTLAEGQTFDEMLASINNSEIEYVVLPEATDKDIIFADYTAEGNMTSLKAVINAAPAYNNQPAIVANIIVPGSLYEARCHALDLGKLDGGTYHIYGGYGVESLTLAGKLNASDICVDGSLNSAGHLLSEGEENDRTVARGLANVNTLKTVDLTDAVFVDVVDGEIVNHNEDMNFHLLGIINANKSLSVVKLPTSPLVNTIPDNCFDKMVSFKDGYICIPYNIEHIGNHAFDETNISHVTTTDKIDGTEIDNGPHTYTFSANLKSIGTVCFNSSEGIDVDITDVYVLATKVPLCAKDAFRENFTYGYGSFGGPGVYSREHYNGTNNSSVAILHFPDEDSFNAVTVAANKEKDYTTMKELYTDITKVYSKKDQTGAVDANGNPLLWPIRTEMNRVYNQASANQPGWNVGVIWGDWSDAGDPWNGINEGPADGDTPPEVCSFAGYEGWHQFVLTVATYVPPTEDIDEETEKVVRNYVDDRWYTFCIPFDMTEREVIELLGVPATEVDDEGKVIGDIIYQYGNGMVTDAKMPEIRTLKEVTRTLNGSKGTIKLSLSDNLAEKKNGEYTYYNASTQEYDSNVATSQDRRGEKIVIRGGYPYIIKPYRWDKITITNLGMSVLDRYEFPSGASSVYREGCFIELGGTHGGENAYKSPFAVPYEGHEVQALFTDAKTGQTADAQYKDGDEMKDYKYRFMGQYWQQPLPLNSYYISSKGNWNYYQTPKDNYFWKPYNCVINISSVLDETKTTYFEEVGMDATGGAVFTGNLYLEYAAGHNDSFVVNENQAARSIRIIFDEAIEEYDSDGNVMTAIDSLDGQDVAPLSGKVYNVKGQYVGNSVEGLSKGIYIVKGKKIVVD